jgi:3-dehydroquinate dehydratase type I
MVLVAEGRAGGADVTVIISHHNYSSTPSAADLQAIVDVCFEYGADIAKIAVTAKSTQVCLLCQSQRCCGVR